MKRWLSLSLALTLSTGTVSAESLSIMKHFEPDATGYSEDNAYALSYFSTMVYAQYLAISMVGTDQTSIRLKLEKDPVYFFTNFMEQVNTLLDDEEVDYTWVYSCNANGFDPEAMVINTSKAIIIAFRGTDRVGCASEDGTLLGNISSGAQYGVAEWISSDFDLSRVDFRFPADSKGEKLAAGKVQRGFWNSLAANPVSYSVSKEELMTLANVKRTSNAAPDLSKREITAPKKQEGADDLKATAVTFAAKNKGLEVLSLSTKPRTFRKNQPFIATLEDVVKKYASGPGAKKKIWVTGHSLGGAHSQLAALFLKKRGFAVQGVYAVAGPNVGSKELTDELDAAFPGNRLTRFVFAQDPVPTATSDKLGFGSAGRIVHMDDLNTRLMVNNDSGVVTGGGSLFRSLAGGVTSLIPVESGLETMCFHHPNWYLNAAFKDLIKQTPGRLGKVRAPIIPIPDSEKVAGKLIYDPCNKLMIDRGIQKNLANVAAEVVQDAIDNTLDAALNFTYDLNAALSNLIGSASFEGVYRLESYASTRAGLHRFIDRDEGGVVNLSALGSTRSDNNFEIRRSGLGGYTIGATSGSRLLTPKAEGLDLLANNLEYDMTKPEISLPDCPWNDPFCDDVRRFPSIEQTWNFYKLKESSNLFIIENRAGNKVIDANNTCSVKADVKDCKIKQYDRLKNDATQLWVLHRVGDL